jgi:hypothetical protein
MLLELLSPKAYRYLYAVNLRKMVIKKWRANRANFYIP